MIYQILVPLLFCSASALQPRLPDFQLQDIKGKSHALKNYVGTARYMVVISQGAGCPTVAKNIPAIHRLARKYKDRVSFILVNANSQDSIAQLAQFNKDFNLEVPVVKDPEQNLLRRLNIKSTTTAVVLNVKNWDEEYFGAISDQVTYDGQSEGGHEPYLADALDALLHAKPVSVRKTPVYGCNITYLPSEKVQP